MPTGQLNKKITQETLFFRLPSRKIELKSSPPSPTALSVSRGSWGNLPSKTLDWSKVPDTHTWYGDYTKALSMETSLCIIMSPFLLGNWKIKFQQPLDDSVLDDISFNFKQIYPKLERFQNCQFQPILGDFTTSFVHVHRFIPNLGD